MKTEKHNRFKMTKAPFKWATGYFSYFYIAQKHIWRFHG